MGCFGYICKGCGTPINGDNLYGGEKCIMMHVRHGKVIGKTEGHYDEYGRVIEDSVFRNDDPKNPNCHSEICNSEFYLDDSVSDKKVYKGKLVSDATFYDRYIIDELKMHRYCIEKSWLKFYLMQDEKEFALYKERYAMLIQSIRDSKSSSIGKGARVAVVQIKGIIEMNMCSFIMYKYGYSVKEIALAYKNLPNKTTGKSSGIVAWHSKCFKEATSKMRNDLTPSRLDTNQSCGNVRKKYK